MAKKMLEKENPKGELSPLFFLVLNIVCTPFGVCPVSSFSCSPSLALWSVALFGQQPISVITC